MQRWYCHIVNSVSQERHYVANIAASWSSETKKRTNISLEGNIDTWFQCSIDLHPPNCLGKMQNLDLSLMKIIASEWSIGKYDALAVEGTWWRIQVNSLYHFHSLYNRLRNKYTQTGQCCHTTHSRSRPCVLVFICTSIKPLVCTVWIVRARKWKDYLFIKYTSFIFTC